jgi:hypothetical protein
MYGLSRDLDLSFFVGKRLNFVTFSVNTISFGFDDRVSITLESSYQHQQPGDIKNHAIGCVQSVPARDSGLMSLIDRIVVAATANEEESGTLSLVFDDGQVLKCFEKPVPYESYSFTDGEQEYVV